MKKFILTIISILLFTLALNPPAYAQVTVEKGQEMKNTGQTNSKMCKETTELASGLKYQTLWQSSNTTIAKGTQVRIDIQPSSATDQNLQSQTNETKSKSIAGVMLSQSLNSGTATGAQQSSVIKQVQEGFRLSCQSNRDGKAYFYNVAGTLP